MPEITLRTRLWQKTNLVSDPIIYPTLQSKPISPEDGQQIPSAKGRTGYNTYTLWHQITCQVYYISGDI